MGTTAKHQQGLPPLPAEFRPIPSLPGYAVSTCGRVLTCRPMGPQPPGVFRCQWEPVKLRVERGYVRFTAKHKGKARTVRVNRAVMLAHVGPCPADMEVLHSDGDSTNNCLENLRYGTKIENAADRHRHGSTVRGERHHKTTLTETDVRFIRRQAAAGETLETLSRRYGITPAAISRIVRRKRWAHLSDGEE